MIESVTPPKPSPVPLKNFTVVMLDGTEKVFKVAGIRNEGESVQLYGAVDMIAIFPLAAIRAVYENHEQQPNPSA